MIIGTTYNGTMIEFIGIGMDNTPLNGHTNLERGVVSVPAGSNLSKKEIIRAGEVAD
jgi:hypothetical protein